MAMKSETYLFPIWVDVHCKTDKPEVIIADLNDKMQDFFEEYANTITEGEGKDISIDIKWSVNKQVDVRWRF